MTQYLLFSDGYPFSADFDSIGFSSMDTVALIARRGTPVVNEAQRRHINQIIEVDDFSIPTLIREIDRNLMLTRSAVLASHDDFIYDRIALVADHYGIAAPSPEGVELFQNKATAKHYLALEQIRFPRYHLLDREDHLIRRPDGVLCEISDLCFPMFAKPTVGAGAENARKLNNVAELAELLAARNLPRAYELDEFIGDAVLFHCELLICQSDVRAFQVCEYCRPCADFSAGYPVGSYTMDMAASNVAKDVAEFAELAIGAMGRRVGLPSGVVHLEAFRRSSGEILFLEAQLRPPGANAKMVYKLHRGMDLEVAHLRLQMGRGTDVPRSLGPFAGWMYFPTKAGVVSSKRELPELKSKVVASDWYVALGQRTSDPLSILDAVGRGAVALSVLICNDDLEQLRKDFAKLEQFEPLEMTA